MSTRTTDYLDAIAHLPEGATLVIPQVGWDDYERLVQDLEREGMHVRVSYDQGRLEIMSPHREHEKYARFIERLLHVISELLDLKVEGYGAATWKSQRLGRGVEPDCCYYVANAELVMAKREFDLETDPPPDVAVEIDTTNQSLGKFSIYAALRVPEIWRYDGKNVQFYELAGDKYQETPAMPSFPGLTSMMLAGALEQSKTEGQTAALQTFRKNWSSKQ